MLRQFFCFMSVLVISPVIFPALANAMEIPAESTITAATVYNDRAKVTRQAVITIPAGAHTIIFKGLPSILLPDSLRAEGKAQAEVKFGALAHKMIMSAQLAAPREKELNGQLEVLNDSRKLAEEAGACSQKKFPGKYWQTGCLAYRRGYC